MSSARIKAYLALAGAALIWGAAQPLVKPALTHIAPIQYMFLRYIVALPMGIIALLFILKKYRPDLKTLVKILLIECISIGNLIILYTGLKYTTALQSSLLLNLRPIFITLMGIFILKEHEEKNEWIGLLLSVLGTGMVIIGPYLAQTPPSEISTLGNSIIVLTNIINMFNVMIAKKTYHTVPKIFVTATNAINGFLWLGIINFAVYGNLPLEAFNHTSVIVAVLYMGILGTFIANSLSIYGFDRIEASEATLFHYLEPLVYIPLAIFWLGESVSFLQIGGLALVVWGVVWAAKRLPKKRAARSLRHGRPQLARVRLAQNWAHVPHAHK